MSKTRTERAAGLAALLAIMSAPAFAQSGPWTFDATAYLWINDTGMTADTPRGEVSAELSFSDAIDALDFAFMGMVEARNGPWGIIGDGMYFKLSADGPTPNGLLFSSVEAESEITMLSGYVVYRVHEDASSSVDIGAGLRGFKTSVETTLVGAGAPTERYSLDRDWIDPVLVARVQTAFNDDWFGTFTIDGGGTDDTRSWQAVATVGYRLNDRWTLQGGYRYLEAEWDTDFGEASLDFSGPIFGATYRF